MPCIAMKSSKNIENFLDNTRSLIKFLKFSPEEQIRIQSSTGNTILIPEMLWSKAQKNNEAMNEPINK